jgi:hypothetical protein
MDVYVDGLPVFTMGTLLQHDNQNTDAFQQLETTFGDAPQNPTVVIYLG